MIGLKDLESIIGLIILLLVYMVSVTIAGCFRAWVAKKMGDDTAEQFGLLTLNPINHFDPFGLAILLLFSDVTRVMFPGLAGRTVPIYTGFGWGRQVPVDASRIHGRYRWLKAAAALFSGSFMHFMLPVVGLFGLKLALATWVPTSQITPLVLLAIQLYRAFLYLNVWLFVVDVVVNGVMFGMLYLGQRASVYDVFHLSWIALFITIVMIFLLGQSISTFIVAAINVIGNLIV